jgi:hypothetical protein
MKLLPKNRVRMANNMANMGMTLEMFYLKMVPEAGRQVYGLEYSEEAFDKWMTATFYHNYEDYEKSEGKHCYDIDNSAYGKPGVAELRRIVGLTGDFDYDIKAIEDVQTNRFK